MATQASFNPHDLLNQTIGGYQLCEILGTGAAVVYRAYDPGKAEYVALKLLAWPGAPLDDIALRRFKREIDLLRKRRHAAIVDIYDWRTNGDYVYMAMEYCDGTLQRWLREHRPTLTEVLEIAEPLAAALDFLHEGPAPVLHRDIKPANILYRGRNWYISDFGIARMEADQLVTTDGTLLGTLRYAAPEQMTAAKLGVETDIYSFGLVIYEMLAGGWVLGARRPTDWAYDVPPISTYHRGLGPAVDALFERWLAPNPAQRPRRAVDAVRELAAASGVLRDPALARLYDLATTLSDRPNDPAAWAQASELLAAIAYHEPAFFDPRGLSADLEARRGEARRGPRRRATAAAIRPSSTAGRRSSLRRRPPSTRPTVSPPRRRPSRSRLRRACCRPPIWARGPSARARAMTPTAPCTCPRRRGSPGRCSAATSCSTPMPASTATSTASAT